MIHARIQHHPSRAHLLPELYRRLSPLPIEVVTHESDPPSPWAGYQLCMADPPDCTHLLIVQDDATPCENFAAALEQVAHKVPDAPVCLFLGSQPRDASKRLRDAVRLKRRYVTLPWRGFMPVVAVLWPRPKLEEFKLWSEQNPQLVGREPRSDDAMAGMWKIRTRQTVVATVPSLVDHPDTEPSLIGTKQHWGREGRRAVYLAADALEYDWS